MMEHAKEPWRLVGHGEVVGGDNNTVAVILEDVKAEANARRIVACVNACAGVPTELLEEYPAPFSEMRNQRDQLQARVNELESQQLSWRVAYLDERKTANKLLAALELLVDVVGANCDADQDEMAVKPAMKRARAAIAAVKGGAPC